MRVEADVLVRKRGARKLEPLLGRGLDIPVTRRGGDEDDELRQPEVPLGRMRDRDVAVVRRVECAAVQPCLPGELLRKGDGALTVGCVEQLVCEIGPWKAAGAHRRRGGVCVVVGGSSIDVRSEHRPPSSGSNGRVTDAAGVHDAMARVLLVELQVRVAADDNALRHIGKDRRPALLRRCRRHDDLVAPRRRVTEQRRAETRDVQQERLRPGRDECELRFGQALAGPAGRFAVALEHEAVGVAEDEPRAVTQRACELECLARPGTPDEIAAEEHDVRRLPLDVGENRLEGRQVAVHVVERGDPHFHSSTSSPTCTSSPSRTPADLRIASSCSGGGALPVTRKPVSVRKTRNARRVGSGR